jgi:hypothetical protein
MASDVIQLELLDRFGRRKIGHDGYIAEPSMWPLEVIMTQPRSQDVAQVAFAKDNKMVEALRLGAADPRLDVWTCSSRRLLLIAGMKSELFG